MVSPLSSGGLGFGGYSSKDGLVQEVGSGRRTPQEVLGDTTWGKGDLSPISSSAASQFTGTTQFTRVSQGTRISQVTGAFDSSRSSRQP